MRDTVTPEALHLPPTRVIDITDSFTALDVFDARDGSVAVSRALERRAARVQTQPMTRAAKQ